VIYLLDFLDKIARVLRQFLLSGLALAVIAGVGCYFVRKGRGKKGLRKPVFIGLFFLYLMLLLGETIFRRIGMCRQTTDFIGFAQLFENPWYFVAAVENVVLFFPFGLLLPAAFKSMDRLWKVLALALELSLFIELVQFILQIGEAQGIDLLTNVIGAGIGFVAERQFFILFTKYVV